jgi:hypothetical protein
LLELSAAVVATLAGPVAIVRPSQHIEPTAAGALEGFRRFVVGALFGLHTYRFRIYLGRDRGILAPIGNEVETRSPRPRG